MSPGRWVCCPAVPEDQRALDPRGGSAALAALSGRLRARPCARCFDHVRGLRVGASLRPARRQALAQLRKNPLTPHRRRVKTLFKEFLPPDPTASMLAAQLSPCRIKRNHRRRRRIASGRAVYAYVRGNSIASSDPFGLTQCDIDAAMELAKQSQKDLSFGKGPPKVDIRYNPRDETSTFGHASIDPNPDGTRNQNADFYTHLNEFYLQKLNDYWQMDLLTTVIHEGVHFAHPRWADELQVENEAIRRTTKRPKEDFRELLRKKCGCE
jgi:hypothetical protein